MKNIRKSHMDLEEIYFWTDTIKDWKSLLKKDYYKEVIIDELQKLKQENKIRLYGYVIMPNHLHFLWELLAMNGREKPHSSFNKWTASIFLEDLRLNHQQVLPYFEEYTTERNHRFWQRDPLAVLMDSKKKFIQKLDYIHYNPLQPKWKLCSTPEEYRWSSANFYMTGYDEFNILTHYSEVF